jgi:hypothetical protein
MGKHLVRTPLLASLLAQAAIGGLVYSEAGKQSEQAPGHYSTLVNQLVEKSNADSLATAGLLTMNGQAGSARTYRLIDQAVKSAPDRSDLAWLAMRLCVRVPGCDVEKPEHHLRRTDPPNAAGWMGELVRNSAANDDVGVDAVLTAMGGAKRFDLYWNPLIVTCSRELMSVQPRDSVGPRRDPASVAIVTMIGIISVIAVPEIQAFSKSCREDAPLTPGRRGRCQRAAEVFEHGDTYTVEDFGLSVEQRVWPQDSAEARRAAVQRRTLHYRMGVTEPLFVASKDSVALPPDYLEVLSAHAREQDASLGFIERAQLAADLPPQWTDPTHFQ